MKKINKKLASDSEILLYNLEKFKSDTYREGVNEEFDTYKACDNGSDCCDHDYCRCGEITNATAIIDPLALSNSFIKDLKDEVFAYCVDRIIQSSNLIKSDYWEPNVCNGYYGQEVSGCTPNGMEVEKLSSNFLKLIELNDYEKIKLALECEYDYLLDNLIDHQYSVSTIEVLPNEISLGNNEYMKKIDNKQVDFYPDYKLPRAVCFKTSNLTKPYRVIDGYHRTTAALKNKIEKIKIILLTKM